MQFPDATKLDATLVSGRQGSVQVMDRVRSIKHNVFSPLQGWGIMRQCKAGSFSSLHLESLQQDPSELDPLEFGWTPEGPSGAYCPSSLPSRVDFAFSDKLKLIKCSCSSDRPCSSQRCTCSSAQLACSLFCKCEGRSTC